MDGVLSGELLRGNTRWNPPCALRNLAMVVLPDDQALAICMQSEALKTAAILD
jgi:hypothetical protein